MAVGAAAGPVSWCWGSVVGFTFSPSTISLSHTNTRTPNPPHPPYTPPHCGRKSGQPFEYVRALYAALSPDHAPLGRESIWAIYQELRRMGPALAAEAGTALYLPMTGCNDRVEGFGSLRAQRHVRSYVWSGCGVWGVR